MTEVGCHDRRVRGLPVIRVADPETGETEVIDRPIAAGTVIRELAGILRPAIEHAIQHRRLLPGSYYIPAPPAAACRRYWITRPEATRLLRAACRYRKSRLHLPLFILLAL